MVFISYATKDARTARQLQSDFEAANITVWRDETRIEHGERLRESINKGLRAADCIILLVSPASLRSRWVLNELDAAMLREIRERRTLVVPILIGRVRSEDLPEDVSGKLYFDLRYNFSKRYAAQKSRLIRRILSLTQPPTPESRAHVLGDEAVAYILHTVSSDEMSVELWKSKFIDAVFSVAFLSQAEKWDFRDEVNGFVKRYGTLVCKAIIAFYFRHYGIDVKTGFSEADFDKVVDDAVWFSAMTSASQFSVSNQLIALEILFEKETPKYRAHYFDRIPIGDRTRNRKGTNQGRLAASRPKGTASLYSATAEAMHPASTENTGNYGEEP
jgi:hypothetical protein